MALNVVSDNDLINNKKLAFTTFTSCNDFVQPFNVIFMGVNSEIRELLIHLE